MKKFNSVIFFLLVFSVSLFAQKKVLFIGDTAAAAPVGEAVKIVLDKIKTVENVTITVTTGAKFKVITKDSVLKFDAVFCTEQPGSGDVENFGTGTAASDKNFCVPAVWLKGYALPRAKWSFVDAATAGDSAGFYAGFKTQMAFKGETGDSTSKMDDYPVVISANKHAIFGNKYTENQEVAWVNATDKAAIKIGNGIFPQSFGFSAVLDNGKAVSGSATKLASFKQVPEMWTMAAIEENALTKRMFIWGIHHYATFGYNDNFYWIVKNALRWVMKVTPEFVDVETTNSEIALSLYPNFVTDGTAQLKFNLPQRCQVNIDIYSLSGKLVRSVLKSSLNAGEHNIAVNTNGLSSGLYVCKVNNTSVKLVIK